MSGKPTNRRRRHYVDQLIQRRLIALLVVLELLLVGGGLVFLYRRFSAVIEANLYRIHASGAETGQALLEAVALVFAALLLINVVALVIADRIWARYVDRVLDSFVAAVERMRALDLRRDAIELGDHRLLDLTFTWRLYERAIWLDVRRETEALERALSVPNPEPERVREHIGQLRRLLSEPT